MNLLPVKNLSVQIERKLIIENGTVTINLALGPTVISVATLLFMFSFLRRVQRACCRNDLRHDCRGCAKFLTCMRKSPTHLLLIKRVSQAFEQRVNAGSDIPGYEHCIVRKLDRKEKVCLQSLQVESLFEKKED